MAVLPFLLFFSIAALLVISPSLSLPTFSVSHTTNHTLVCALLQSGSAQPGSFLNCRGFSPGRVVEAADNPVSLPGVPVSSVAGGNGFVCAVVPASVDSNDSSLSIRCWRFSANGTLLPFFKSSDGTTQSSKRVYIGPPLEELAAGPTHLCGVLSTSRRLNCWQWANFDPPDIRNLTGLVVGGDFVCGLNPGGNVECLGLDSEVTGAIPAGRFTALAAGDRHVCGVDAGNGNIRCWGTMSPASALPVGQFESVAVSGSRSCAVRMNGTAVCWGDGVDFRLPEELVRVGFVAVNGNGGVFCGILNRTYALVCWGDQVFGSANSLAVFDRVQPGSCRTDCNCPLIDAASFCPVGQRICGPCWRGNEPLPAPLTPPVSARPSNQSRGKTAFLVVGVVGCAIGAATSGFFLLQFCKRRSCRVHDSGRLDEEASPPPPPAPSPTSHLDQPESITRVSSGSGSRRCRRSLRGNWLARLRSSTSRSNRRVLSLPEEFSLETLRLVTNDFSEQNKIGSGSFGSVYRATLEDGRDVAIKRADMSSSSSYAIIGAGMAVLTRRQEKESAFRSELALLSCVNHKNLVRLLGFCEEGYERVLVYDYMPNSTLHHHLHRSDDSPLTTWTRRIKVALDAARGIEYLHCYAVNPIIHRDIKSSNILLDASWTAKVADFGLSLFGPSDGVSPLSLHAAGTVGYIDPEYYRRQRLTAKSDVYSFGVVLLELLSGTRAIHRVGENGPPRNLVDHLLPYIESDNLHRVLDPRVPPPTPCEIEAVNSVGYLAAECVLPDGRCRPTMTEIVVALERALIVCLTEPSLLLHSSSSSGRDRQWPIDIHVP